MSVVVDETVTFSVKEFRKKYMYVLEVKKAIVRCEKRSVNPVTAFDCGFQAGVKAVKEEFELVFERE